MPTAQALESLKILSGGPSYRRVLPTEEYGFSGEVPTQGELDSPFEREQTARATAANARDRQINEYNRPDVKAIRDEEENDALKRLLLPIQMKGQYDVEAAKEHARANAANTQALIAGRQGVADTNQSAITARSTANAKAVSMRQRLQALQTGKAHAAPPTGLSSWVPGSQGRADQAEIQDLLKQIAAAGPEANDMMGEPSADAMVGGETAAQQLARLRAGRRQ